MWVGPCAYVIHIKIDHNEFTFLMLSNEFYNIRNDELLYWIKIF